MCRDFDLSVVNCIAGSRFCSRLCANRKQGESYSSVSRILGCRTTSDETLAESVEAEISYRRYVSRNWVNIWSKKGGSIKFEGISVLEINNKNPV